ncbi:MAG: zinc-ribbon domain-containing protein [bacterium]
MIVSALTWAGIALVALFVGWPLLQARIGREPSDPDTVSPLERQKRDALQAIKEAEFDRSMGKLSDEDFATLTGRYRTQALAAMTGIAAARRGGGTGESRAIAYCPQCGTKLAARANFCGGCGHALRQRAA